MVIQPRNFVRLLLKAGLGLLVVNEVRGLVLAAPVLYGMYEAGGTTMAVWLGVCSLAGIALSVLGPLIVAKRLKLILVTGRAMGFLDGCPTTSLHKQLAAPSQ